MALPKPYKIGEVFRNWTIKDHAKNNKFNQKMVWAECKCGSISKVVLSSIRNKKNNMCKECNRNGPVKPKKLKDVYGLLTVLEYKPGSRGGKSVNVKCVCGKVFWVSLSGLDSGNNKSCGCRGSGRKTKRDLGYIKKGATTDTFTVFGKEKTFEVDGSRPRQPNTSANKARMAGICHQGGMCRYYQSCGNKSFECDCRGYQPPKTNKYYTNGNDTIRHGGVL